MNSALSQKAAQVLEWTSLLEFLSQQAQSTLGSTRCRTVSLAHELSVARIRQQETTEMLILLSGTEPVPTLTFPNIHDLLIRACKGGILDAPDLRDCGIVLALMEEVGRYVMRHRVSVPALAGFIDPLRLAGNLPSVKRVIESAIRLDGSIREAATPELRRLTHQAHELKAEMRERLDRMLQSRRYEECLQENYFAEREGRYVLLVKADMRGRIPGIVHDVSASGATVFFEPRDLVELNNSIKVADLEVDREVRRILREITALVAADAHALETGLDALAEWDAIRAKAEVSRRFRANPVVLNDQGRVALKGARHPLLMLAKDQVVPNDIRLDESTQVLVISGPNTGGKTVTLKIMGLYALMVRAGLHLPCSPDSEMALFTEIYADIGDAQDLSQDLSSFSAHMTQMVQLLSETNERAAGGEPSRVRSLVLLDEPVTSTDPQEGAALAEALLCHLASLNIKVVVTTHYGSLKELAQTTPGFANASVEFDMVRLAPTYRLFLGIPGSSSALEIARRLGMDETILRDARRRLKHADSRLDGLMADLQRKQREIAEDTERARQAREEAERESRNARELRAHLEAVEQQARKELKRKLGEQFQRARAEVQATVEAVKREQKLIKAKEAKERLTELETQSRQTFAPAGEPIPIEQLGIGDQVEIVGLGMTGLLLDAPQGKKRVRVKVGEGELLANVASLTGVARAADVAPPPAVSSQHARRGSFEVGVGLDQEPVIDVRGLAADDAVDLVIAGLDRAAMGGAGLLRIIHGQGTGRLKSILRRYLNDSPYVERFRPGEQGEGGDGLTIVTLKK